MAQAQTAPLNLTNMQAFVHALPPLRAYALRNSWDGVFITAVMQWTIDRESRPHPSFALLGSPSELASGWEKLVKETLDHTTDLTSMEIAALKHLLDQGVEDFSAVEALFGCD